MIGSLLLSEQEGYANGEKDQQEGGSVIKNRSLKHPDGLGGFIDK